MCSLTIQFSLLQSLSRPSSSFSPNLEPKLSTSSVSFPLKMKSRICNKSLVLRVKSYGSSNNQPSDSSAEFTPPSGNLVNTYFWVSMKYCLAAASLLFINLISMIGFTFGKPKTRRDILLEYVQSVKPEFMELFVKRAPKHVKLLFYFEEDHLRARACDFLCFL